MDHRNSDVNVPRFSGRGFFTVESVNGVTTVSLHHFPNLSSTMEADGIERPGVNPNCVPVVPVPSFFPISGQRELGSDSREGCSFNQETELNPEVPLNCESELITRDVYLPQQYTNRISQAFKKTENQVLQPECRKRSSDRLQLESTKKLKKRDIMGNPEKNDKPFSRVNDDSKKCVFADGKNSMSALLAKKAEKRNVPRAKDDSNLDATLEVFDMKENAELKEQQQMKGASIPPKKHNMSTKLQKSSKKECMICGVSVFSQADLESHVAGRKHAKMLKISEFSESLLKRKGCANAYHKESVKSDNGSMLKDNVKKTVEVILELKDEGGLKADKNDINEFANINTDLNESGPSDYGPLIKDHVDKTAGKINNLEFKHDGVSGAHNEKDDLKEFVEPK